MSACEAELCPFWTGQGCACDVMGLDRDAATYTRAAEEDGQ